MNQAAAAIVVATTENHAIAHELNASVATDTAHLNVNAPVNAQPVNTAATNESPELARAREIAKRLGMISTDGQDFDVPAFMRRGADKDANI